jgi:tetratricopeptide (TPR) repeat protein
MKSIAECNHAIVLNPKDGNAYAERGAVYASMGQHTKTIEDFTQAIMLNAESKGIAYWYRGCAYTDLGQYDKAIEDLTKAIELGPSDITYHSRGCAYGGEEKYEQALFDFEIALRLNPNNSEARKKVNILKEAGYKAESEGEAKAKAKAKAEAEQKEKAAFRQKYNETNGKDISLSDVVKDSEGKWAYDGDVKAAKAAADAKAKAYADAIADANAKAAKAKAKQRKKRNSIIIAAIVAAIVATVAIVNAVNAQIIKDWYLKGNEYYDKRDYTNAISAYSQAINSEGGYVEADRKAKAAAAHGREVYSYTVRHRWTGPEIDSYFNRGRVYYLIKNYDAAITDLETVANNCSPDFYQINAMLGDAYGAKKEYDKAVSYYEKYLELKSPDEPENFTVDKSNPADMWFCATLWRKNLLTHDPKYEKWIKEICDGNPVTRTEIEAFYQQNGGW